LAEGMVQRDNTVVPAHLCRLRRNPNFKPRLLLRYTTVQARHLHVVNMLIAWIILVPLAFFVSRYYKETFSKVFFLQEFWWYDPRPRPPHRAAVHVGSFYSMHLRREGSDYKTLWTDATTIHIYFGYTLIRLHWGFGWAEYILAAFTFASAAGMPQGLMNCESFCVYVAFLFFQVLFYAIMEKHSRIVDKRLDLEPPRRYFPVHSMRIFHKDAPGSVIRIVMLIAYFLISIAFYAALHILTVQNPNSCFQKVVGAVALF
ncbi:Ferric-chelate reductase 1, partial [Orchesella cincta]